MARDVAAWLGASRRMARTVTLKVRYDDFTTITRCDSRVRPDDASTPSPRGRWRCSNAPKRDDSRCDCWASAFTTCRAPRTSGPEAVDDGIPRLPFDEPDEVS